MGGRSGEGCVNKKPPAPCLTGEPPEGIQQQQVYSTNVNGIVPEQTRLVGAIGAYSLWERAWLQYILLRTLEIVQCIFFRLL